MPWAAAASIGGSLLSAGMQSDSASNASATQAQSTANQVAENARQYDQNRSDSAPYRTAGANALGTLQGEMGQQTTPSDVMNEPGYQFGLQQGQQAIDRQSAANGGRDSGAALKSAAAYATNYATAGYGAAYQRRQDRLNRLSALANIGQTATAGSAATGAASSNALTSILNSQGNSSAAGQLAQGNIWGNAINQVAAQGSRYNSGSNVSNGALFRANMSSDPIASLNNSQGWTP